MGAKFKYFSPNSSIFLSEATKATVSKLGEEIQNGFKDFLKNNYVSQPHGGAITAHFTFRPVTLEP